MLSSQIQSESSCQCRTSRTLKDKDGVYVSSKTAQIENFVLNKAFTRHSKTF